MKKSFIYCGIAYILATIVAVGIVLLLPTASPLIRIGAADLAATLVIFLASVIFNNSSFYDPYWSVAPPLICLFWIPYFETLTLRQIVIITLLVFWAGRLTYNWALQWRGIGHEDWRYKDIRTQTGRLYWMSSLVGIHIMPTVIVFLGCLPLSYSLTTGTFEPNWLDVVASVITLAAVLIEASADTQLHKFIKTRPGPDAVMREGLWAYSRHPNYFGEVSFWFGMFLFGLAADPDAWWTVIGSLVMFGLFMFISIPLMERHMLKRKSDFAHYRTQVSVFFPWLPSRTDSK